MIRILLSLLSIFLLWFGTITRILAEETPIAPITQEQLEWGKEIAEKAFEATQKENFTQAETYWTQLIKKFPINSALWSNRGNTRVSQNKLDKAIADFNKAVELAPNESAIYLNRGTALERQGKYQEAIINYNRVLEIAPNDAMAYNNRGNAQGSLGNWEQALKDYQTAVNIDPDFTFAKANVALVFYQLGNTKEALKQIKNIIRKYPMFPDTRAALTAILWDLGKQGEAESNWVATVGMDNRYQDLDWVTKVRRWPPRMITALDKFLNLK
ncbi:MAG: tetratricopeptide repeat protein [cyanobacterium endosymbiont of Rhopalodia musculus]